MRALASAALLLSLLTAPAVAAPGDGEPKTDTAARAAEAARGHFRNGIKLYQDGNYIGGLAEFQASYRLKPAGSTLQNMALCQKKLFRYAEAADTLAELLKLHSGELDAEQTAAVKQTMQELEGLVGRVRIVITPAEARVSLDGKNLSAAQLAEPIRVNVGEHRVRAEAPGYAPIDMVLRVASGEAPRQLRLELKAVKGFVEIVASDPGAAIAIDGRPLAYQRYSGPVDPGEHYVQVYKAGHKTFEQVIQVEVGRTVRLKADIGPSDGRPIVVTGAPAAPPQPTVEQRGFYIMAALNALGVSANPTSLAEETQEETGGGAFGVHGGYRVWSPVAVEALLEGARHDVKACERGQTCNDSDVREYALSSVRFGTNLRLFSSGEKLRFSGALGFGVVRQALELKATSTSAGGEASGIDPYFMVEVGAQYNAGHWLLGLAAIGYFNGTSSVEGDLGGPDDGPVYEDNGLVTAGIGIRFGWSSWKGSFKRF